MAQLPYLPQTEADVKAMLARIGVNKLEDLYSDVPAQFLHKGAYALPDALSEQEIRDYFASLEAMNARLKVFVGQGAYDHYTPSVIPYLCSRSEFLTAYTPYQCEISQGTLRYIFEYQSMMCELTGLDVSNASMYDGPTAAAEAMKMAIACARKKTRVLLSATRLPNVIAVVKTYAKFHGVEIGLVPADGGQTSLEALKAELAKDDVAGVIVPSVNRYGIVEDHSGFAEAIHARKAILVEYCDPSTLAVVNTPGEWGADVAVGDGQSLGLPLCYGGPYVGFMTVKKEHMRKMPGRIVGQTVDKDGWYHTGDLGLMDEDGNVFIKGRSKNMLLGSNGQNIYPEEIEDKLNSLPMVMESVVIQEQEKLVALVHPDYDEAKALGMTNTDLASIMDQNRLQLNEIVPHYSKVAEIRIHEEEFAKTPKKSIKRFLYQP
ncbi:MAG: aminomethyl-transferring glycine dehydrogenase subunit GcvPA [Bacteroidales bacterium]|nr:aminomethyl-transferring glycine dehydrogenase subunit GcvPA [Bacteroidales bacterium]